MFIKEVALLAPSKLEADPFFFSLPQVSEEVKRDPRFQNSLASVNKIASDTLSNLGAGAKDGSQAGDASASALDAFSSSSGLANNNVTDLDKYFSLGDDDESAMTPPPPPPPPASGESDREQSGSPAKLPVQQHGGAGAGEFQSVELGE